MKAGQAWQRFIGLRRPTGHRLWLVMRAMARQALGLEFLESAASLAFLSLVAIVPIASLGLLVIASVPAFAEVREQLQAVLAANLLLPQVADTVLSYVNQFAAGAARLSLVGTLFFFITALGTMLAVEDAFNRIWRSARRRSLFHRVGMYWVALTAGPLLLAAVVAVNLRIDAAIGGSGLAFDLGIPHWVPWLLTTILLTLAYRLIPNRPVRNRHAVIGAAVAAVLLEGLKGAMTLYVTSFPTYEIVYGAFSVLPVFLFWLYAVWIFVLLGALLAANLGFADIDGIVIAGPAAEFERARTILSRIVARGPGDGIQVSEIGALFGHSAQVADRVGAALARLGYIIRVWPVSARAPANHVWSERWLASPTLPTMSLRALHDDIWLRGRLLDTRADRGELLQIPESDLLNEPMGSGSR